ncbi:ABC transporter substrate-binding protein [Metallumcola ferriviriculae]|uniref:ABC transporter substrate-binding protein n=1 Tax=Metallumcola ferriviriculae TaxID=3039180 RepID=A0AAU0UMY5_9FIRM|nr:ABC transporter substrate-binding protein [Desulfitibacteraceae bacterium MK1]
MKLIKGTIVTLLVLGLLIFAVACGSTDTPDNSSQAPDDTKAEVNETPKNEPPKEVVIGFSGPLSGPAAQYGKDNVNGLEMGIDNINENGGITIGDQKYTFKLEAMDDQADPTQAVNNARRMRDQFDVPAIFNPVFTTIAPLMGINQEPGNEFLMMAYSSTPAILQMDNDLVVRIPPSFLVYVNGFAEIAWENGWRKGGMVVTLGGYGDEWREAFREKWESMGGEITVDQPANYYTETDFSTQLSAVLASNPDFILIGGPTESTALVIEQARNLGYEGPLMLVDQAKMDHVEQILGGTDLMHGVMGVPATKDAGTAVAEEFKKAYESKYGTINTWESVWNYMAIHALVAAMEEAGTVDDPVAIRAAFPKVFPLSGEKYPAEMYDIGERGAIHGLGGVQIIDDNGNYTTPTNYVWWSDSEEVLNDVKEFSQLDNIKITEIEE